MSSHVTPQFLLEGALYALEQCGHLLRDAKILFEKGSYANAVVLGAFAREEVGRSKILMEVRKDAIAGEKYTAERVERRCKDHLSKQKRGMCGTTLRRSDDTDLAKYLEVARRTNGQGSEFLEANRKIDQKVVQIQIDLPKDRQRSRERAQYVGPLSPTVWNRPWQTATQSSAQEFLTDVCNDYNYQYRRFDTTDERSTLKYLDSDLFGALVALVGRPDLPNPSEFYVWPV